LNHARRYGQRREKVLSDGTIKGALKAIDDSRWRDQQIKQISIFLIVLSETHHESNPPPGLIIRIQARRILPVTEIAETALSAIHPVTLFRLPAPTINPSRAELKIVMPEEKNTIASTTLQRRMKVKSMTHAMV
jgi:hypothetical protein